MPRRKPPAFPVLPANLRERLRPPIVVALGPPNDVVALLADFAPSNAVCYQMDLYYGDRLQRQLIEAGVTASVVVAEDLWDHVPEAGTVIYLAERGGERAIKLDVVEQAYHVLRPGGVFVVASDYEADQLFPPLLKKVFGRVHAPQTNAGSLLWCERPDGPAARRRHEMTFQAKIHGGPSLRFLSRPNTFSYGRFDDGARALAETMEIHPGDRVLDLGCGCGTNGLFAAQVSGPTGRTVLADSNLRAVALARLNAEANALPNCEAVGLLVADRGPDGWDDSLGEANFDVVLANPPYFGQTTLAKRFIDRAAAALRPGGRFYLVTKQPEQIGQLVVDVFDEAEVVPRRGYNVLFATMPEKPGFPHAEANHR